MTLIASVNGSDNHGLAFASHSVCFSQHACTIEVLLLNVGSMSCAQQTLTRDNAMCSSKKAKIATFQPMYFCPHCLGSVLVIYLFFVLHLSWTGAVKSNLLFCVGANV